jgi:hypothetical protein
MTAPVLGPLTGSTPTTYNLDLATIQDVNLPVAIPIIALHFRWWTTTGLLLHPSHPRLFFNPTSGS